MATQHLIWTALPNGFSTTSGFPRLSVHLAPRLLPSAPQGTLSEFPDFLSWPSSLPTTWDVEFNSSPRPVSARVVTNPAPTAARWGLLFNATTPVDRRTFDDFTQRKVYSYPRASLASFVRDTYQQALGTADQFPSRASLQQRLRVLVGEDHGRSQLSQVETAMNAEKALAPRAADPGFDFARFRRYHTPPAVRQPGAAGSPTLPRFDIHAMWSLMQDHAPLLRMLGLVIDLELNEFPPANATAVRVRPTWTPQLPSSLDVRPWTNCTLAAGGTFRATELATGDSQDGYLRLEDPASWGVDTFDVDGAAFKLLDVVNAIDPIGGKPTLDTPQELALASLRAAGLGVYRKDRAYRLRENRWVRGKALDAQLLAGTPPGSNIFLNASDLVQGARFDVQANPSSAVAVWRSLMSRATTYAYTNSSGVTDTVAFDEANAAEAGTSAPGSGPTGDFYLGESVVHWDGWTLGAPRPGKVVANDDKVYPASNAPMQGGLPLVISHRAVPGSLEKLRFGQTYRFRARTVDLAGNALPPSDPSALHASAPAFFGRFEPVAAPAVLRRTGSTPGDTGERLVIRSNYDTPAAPPTDERHLLAPKAAQLTCELHGVFDSMAPTAAYNFIVGREAKVLEDVNGAQEDARDPKTYFVNADTVTAPYLPDPMAVGVTLRNLAPNGDATVPFAGTWPDLQAARLVLAEAPAGDPGSFTTDAQGAVRVLLPKGTRRKVLMSSLPSAQLTNVSGLWNWLVETGGVTEPLTRAVRGGRHWMFTPWREVELVHAVKQPLVPPVFTALQGKRNPGDTFATMDGRADFHRASTARIDLEASWVEAQDEGPGGPLPTRPDETGATLLDAPSGSGVVSVHVGEGLRGVPAETTFLFQEVPAPGARHVFQDTKHRDVQYLSRGYSAFDDFFRVTRVIDVSNPVTLDAAGVVAGSVRLANAPGAPKASWSEGVDFTVDAAAGTVQRAMGSRMPAMVEASWVPRPNDRVAPAPFAVNIPSSARPAAPRVKYIVPTFSEETTGSGYGQTKTRSGGGLRVYLERPWWSSGAGELLGVVFSGAPPVGQGVLGPKDALVCTQWGVDPIHRTAPTLDALLPSVFPLAKATAMDLQVPEAPMVRLSVAGHAVGFDAARDLWYCDLQLDSGAAYFPFVRLALARYQASSLPGLELSPVVLTDFVQLPAGRTASIAPLVEMRVGGGQGLSVSVSGPTFDASTNDPVPPRVTVTVQRRLPDIPGALGWEDVGAPVDLGITRAQGATFFASGAVELPTGIAQADLRLVLREYELIRTDGNAQDGAGSVGQRPVWAEILPLA